MDHGHDMGQLAQHVAWGVGYFGREFNRSFILTFGWVMLVNAF